MQTQHPLPKMGTAPILVHVCCGQTAAWINMLLGRVIGLNPDHIVLHGDVSPLLQWGTGPQFSVHVYCGQTVAHLSYC